MMTMMVYLPEEGEAVIRSFWNCGLDKESFIKRSKLSLLDEVSVFAWAPFYVYFNTLFVLINFYDSLPIIFM